MEQTRAQERITSQVEFCSEVSRRGAGEAGWSALSQSGGQHVGQPTQKGEFEIRSAHKKTRDPKGGLTAAGRREFAKRDGSHLKPGVKKAESEMSPEEMRRKGSWATRFYGRETLPPLVDKSGRPSRFALTAAAWGEPVPKTVAAARRIAAKGRALLKMAKRT